MGVGPTVLVLVEMPEDAPTHPPLAVQVLEVGINNISITWEPPPEEFHNGLIRTYQINLIEIDTELSFTISTSYLEHTFLHLHPYYTYNITVAAMTVAIGPYSSVISETTLETAPSSPPLNLIVTELTSTSFIVMWDSPLEEDQNGELQDYFILLTSDRDDTLLEHATGENFLMLESLFPYTKYSIIVAASTQAGMGPYTDEVTVKTEEDAPSVPPANLIIEDILATSILLQWSSLEVQQLNGELSHYLVKVIEEDTNTELYVTSTTTSYTLESLHPYYNYHISVAAVTIAPGLFSEELIVRTLEDAPISPPRNVTAKSLSSSIINVKWNSPPYERTNGIIRHYTCAITARQPWINVSFIIEVNGTEVNLTDLRPHTTYYIRVRAITIFPGPYSAALFLTTMEDAPSHPPINSSVLVLTSNTVELIWTSPALKDLNGVLQHFIVKLCEKNSSSENYTEFATLKKESSPVLIENLHPFYSYKMAVAAKTISTGPYSKEISWKMPEDAPSSPPSNIVIQNVTSSVLLINWNPPVESSQNGIIRSYFIQLVNTYTGESQNFTTSGESTFLAVSDLHPAHTYVIDMVAITILEGPFSNDVFVTLKEDVPTGPPEHVNLHIMNATHIEATWHPPNEHLQNGVIISYKITITTDGQQVHQIYSNATRTLLPLLTSYKEYSISVAASTQVGTGPFSEPMTFNTPETAPSGPPNNIIVDSITATSFRSSWLLPHNNIINGLVRYFVVRIIVNETNRTSEVIVHETKKEFIGLHPYYTYVVQVAAYTVGLGPYSQPLTIRTLEAAPSSPPRAITITEVGSTYFNASWEPPLETDRNGIIRHYRVNVRRNNSLDDPHVVFRSDSNPTVIVTPVLPYHVYFFSISAITNEPGPESTPVILQTLEDAPSGVPLNFQAINITSRTIILTWYEPERENINGILRHFHLSVSEFKSSVIEDIKFNSTSTQYLLKELKPYTAYECLVSAITIDEGPPATLKVKTAQEAPGFPPESVNVEVHDPHSMTVAWRPPASEHNGVIIGYNVNVTQAYVNSNPEQHFTNSTSLYLTGLRPYSTYHVEVAAVTVDVGPYSDFTYALIPEAAPSLAPQNLSVILSSSTSIYMSWHPPPEGHINGVLRSYSIIIWSHADSEIIYSDVVDHETQETQIYDLHPHYQYTCSVSALTNGDGPSTNVTIQMPADIPSGAPLSITTNLSHDTTLVVSWKAPQSDQQNGIIQSYVVEFITLDTNETEIFMWNQLIFDYPGLHPFYTYQVKIAASTSAGVGPYSNAVFYSMPPSRPSCLVANITATVNSTSKVLLSWMPPNHSCWNGIITNYTISVRSLGPQNITFFDDIDNDTKEKLLSSYHIMYPNPENEFKNDPDPRSGSHQRIVCENMLISNLRPFFKYVFEIHMSNKVGDSDPSSSSVVSLPGKEPTAPPENIKIQTNSSTSISLSFKPPNILKRNGIISGYIVKVIIDDIIKEQYFSHKDCLRDCQITGLRPFTHFVIAVAAFSNFGIGTFSRNFSAQTMEDVPGKPLNLTVENIHSVYFISWMPPLNPNGIILKYEVRYFTSSTSLKKRDASKKVSEISRYTNSLSMIVAVSEKQVYVFRVRAHTSAGYGDFSNEVAGQIAEAGEIIEAQRGDTKDYAAVAGIGWIIALILLIVVCGIIYKIRKSWKKTEVSTDLVEMNLNTEWKENKLYQDSETVEKRYHNNEMDSSKHDATSVQDSLDNLNDNDNLSNETQESVTSEEDNEFLKCDLIFENKMVGGNESIHNMPINRNNENGGSKAVTKTDDEYLHENISHN